MAPEGSEGGCCYRERPLEGVLSKYVGCYVDDIQKRALRGVSFFDYKKMTVFRCQDNCAERGYLYAGLEFGAECYCGHKVQGANVTESECNMECKGERSSACGGANRLSIYRLELNGSAIFKGCFLKPDNVSLALPVTAVLQNISTIGPTIEAQKWTEVKITTQLIYEEDLRRIEDCLACLVLVFPLDNRCMDRRFLPSRSKLLQALASFPGAGNTWARHLIELATGFYSGSYYFDGSLYNKGFKGERDHWRSGRTICIKTHESGKKEIEAFDSGILMIRNPYKALMAEFNRKYGGHIGFASQAHWKGKEWPEFVKNYAPWWASHTLDWLRYGRHVHVVHFEDLKRDLFSQLKAMVLFLGPVVSEDRLLCVEGQKDGNFKRSGLRKLEYDPYTPEMCADINKLIRTVDVALRAKNMSGVPMEYMPR
uniref:WSC domain containing 2 n=1 Tax=Gadus morhua TaxID=8049 RepID=A0A8C5BA59_GADMO